MSNVDGNHDGESLVHRGLLYGSEEEFLAGTVPFIREGLDRGDPIKIVTTERNASWLRTALDTDTQQIVFNDSSQWYQHPVTALSALPSTVQGADLNGRRLRMIGEPLWTTRTAQQRTEWARYESLVNVVLASAPAAFLCTYDTSVVHPDALTRVAPTHPELVVDGAILPSPNYTDPAVFNAECDKSPLPKPPLRPRG